MKKITKKEAWEILKTKRNSLETVVTFNADDYIVWNDVLEVKLNKIEKLTDTGMLDSVCNRQAVIVSNTYIEFTDGSRIYFNSFRFRFTYKHILILVSGAYDEYYNDYWGKLIVYSIK